MRKLLAGAAALTSMLILSAAAGAASPTGAEALPVGYNDAVYYSVAIDRPGAQFTPQPI